MSTAAGPPSNAPEQNPSPPIPSAPWLSRRAARIAVLCLAVVGVESWLLLGRGDYGHQRQPWFLLAALIAGFIPPLRNVIDWAWRAIERPSLRAQLLIALVLAVLVPPFLYWCERLQHIALIPKYQDEYSYAIQTQMLSIGRLWMPQHPVADFFESFYILVHPVYASQYFPGAAMAFVPTLWLRVPMYWAPLAEAGLCAALLFLIITELLDGPSGILAVLLILGLSLFRMVSVMLLAQIPMLLLGLGMTLSYLRWRKRFAFGWVILLGALGGWGAITRPADALSFVLVIGIAMVMDLWRVSPRRWIATCLILAAAALPFLAIQLVFDRGVTGHWLLTPFQYYARQFYPGAGFGIGGGAGPLRHVSDIPQKQMFYEGYARGSIAAHQLSRAVDTFLHERLLGLSLNGVADPFLWGFIPLSLPALWNRKRWAVWGVLPLSLVLYTFYTFTAAHYFIVVVPALILMMLLPIRFVGDVFPAHRAQVRTSLGLALAALALLNFPQLDRLARDQKFADSSELERINEILATKVRPPAVVLFHFNWNKREGNRIVTDHPENEPVYNIDRPWPDASPIIRAQDLNASPDAAGRPGDRDLPLYQYYAKVDPRRMIWLYDRAGGVTGKLRRLGTAAELAHKLASTRPR